MLPTSISHAYKMIKANCHQFTLQLHLPPTKPAESLSMTVLLKSLKDDKTLSLKHGGLLGGVVDASSTVDALLSSLPAATTPAGTIEGIGHAVDHTSAAIAAIVPKPLSVVGDNALNHVSAAISSKPVASTPESTVVAPLPEISANHTPSPPTQDHVLGAIHALTHPSIPAHISLPTPGAIIDNALEHASSLTPVLHSPHPVAVLGEIGNTLKTATASTASSPVIPAVQNKIGGALNTASKLAHSHSSLHARKPYALKGLAGATKPSVVTRESLAAALEVSHTTGDFLGGAVTHVHRTLHQAILDVPHVQLANPYALRGLGNAINTASVVTRESLAAAHEVPHTGLFLSDVLHHHTPPKLNLWGKIKRALGLGKPEPVGLVGAVDGVVVSKLIHPFSFRRPLLFISASGVLLGLAIIIL